MEYEDLESDILSYSEALSRLRNIADRQRACLYNARRVAAPKGLPSSASSNNSTYALLARTNTVSLSRAVGQQCAKTIRAPHATPRQDSAAVDGFALCSSVTKNASVENPVSLRVISTFRPSNRNNDPASDLESEDESDQEDDEVDDFDKNLYCFEVKSGTRFPVDRFPDIDAVVPYHDLVNVLEAQIGSDGHGYITITRPIDFRQNRRLTGSDLQRGSVVIQSGEFLQPKHVLVLASLKFAGVPVMADLGYNDMIEQRPDGRRKLTMGVLSIGSDLMDVSGQWSNMGSFVLSNGCQADSPGRIPNSSGSYLIAASQASNVDVETANLGVATDSYRSLTDKLRRAVEVRSVDVCVATGGFSISRWDMIRSIIRKELGGDIVIDGVAVEPGQHILVATIPQKSDYRLEDETFDRDSSSSGMTVFFGILGNSLACVADFHFFVQPYLDMLDDCSFDKLSPFFAKDTEFRTGVAHSPNVFPRTMFSAGLGSSNRSKPADITAFWMAKQRDQNDQEDCPQPLVDILNDQCCHKVSSILDADCWVVAPHGTTEFVHGDEVDVVPI